MPKRLPFKMFSVLILVLIPFLIPRTKGKPEIAVRPEPPPKLILVLVIDQFRYDYLVRFRPQFVEGGFKLLLSGANFVDCRYDYATTATCPGHATLFTGAYPNVHGIIGNDWYDKRRYRRVYCAEDPDTNLVGGMAGPGFSPRKLMGTTVGDELRMATGFQSKVIAISLKDRASTIPGGHTANAAYWYDVTTGNFVSSTYYMPTLANWAAAFNDTPPAQPYCGRPWLALPETPEVGGRVLRQFNPEQNEACPDGKFLGWLHYTPFMSEIELNFARAAIKNEHLGQGRQTDLLALSLSVNDYIGHGFGPYSPEVADTTLRTDRYLAEFFKDLDQMVGLDNVWIALSADHGVAPTPKFSTEHHLSGPKSLNSAIEQAVEQALSKAFGQDRWVQDLDEFYVSLNRFTLDKHQVDVAKAEALAAEAAASVPGVRAAYTYAQLLQGPLPYSPLARKVSNSFNDKRSADVFLVSDPFAVTLPPATGSEHGTPWNYDAQVPLVLWGKAFKPGVYADPVQPIDLAPTLAAALGISQPSGAQGRPLVEALK